jgi:putative addiction module component (TIGR02574 family)
MASLLNALGIDALSTEQRWQLLQELSESLEAEAEEMPLTEAQERELDRRIAALDANPDAVVPWEEVEARALARLRR